MAPVSLRIQCTRAYKINVQTTLDPHMGLFQFALAMSTIGGLILKIFPFPHELDLPRCFAGFLRHFQEKTGMDFPHVHCKEQEIHKGNQ